MEHTSLDCSFSQKIRTAALIAAPLVLSTVASADVLRHEFDVSASYFGNSYFQFNPWTGATAKESSYGDAAYPLALYFCGVDGGSLSGFGGSSWAATVDGGDSANGYGWGGLTLFSEGGRIDGSTSFVPSAYSEFYYSANIVVDASVTQYAGFSFVSGASVHYGYLEFHVTPNQTEFFGETYSDPIITFTAASVNNVAGQGITIPSAAAAIPEPASASLLFGAVALGAIAGRRRRRAAHV